MIQWDMIKAQYDTVRQDMTQYNKVQHNTELYSML